MVKPNKTRLNSTKRDEVKKQLEEYLQKSNPFQLQDFVAPTK